MGCEQRPSRSGAGGGGRAYLYHGGRVLKACGHRWQGPAAGDSSSAPSVPAPRAYRACSTKGHSEEDLKEEGSGRGGPDPEHRTDSQWARGGGGRRQGGPTCGEGRRCTGREPARLGGSGRTSVRAGSCRRPGPPAGRAGRMRAEDAGRARALAREANPGDLAEGRGGP